MTEAAEMLLREDGCCCDGKIEICWEIELKEDVVGEKLFKYDCRVRRSDHKITTLGGEQARVFALNRIGDIVRESPGWSGVRYLST